MSRRVWPFLVSFLAAGCMAPTPVGQFGPYHRSNKFLRLDSGDSITVYRVKLWQFENGEPPALQLEYESPTTVADTASVLAFASRLWPVFRPYVDSAHVGVAILTATNLQRRGWGRFGTTSFQSYGLVASKGPDDRWYLPSHPDPLPPADQSESPRIFEPTGQALPFRIASPTPQ